MARRENHWQIVRQIALLLVVPVFVMSTVYALFSQQLSVNAMTDTVSYVSNQYLVMTYTKNASLAGSTWTYNMNPVTIKNNGATSVTAWQVTFTVPADAPTPTCASTVICTKSGTTVTVKNGTGNGTIATGATRTFTMSFTSTTASYVLENINISGTFTTTYQAISGLTVNVVKGVRSGGAYPLTITISNNSGQPISGWQVAIPTKRRCTSTVPTGTTYTCTTTFLTYTRAAGAIANGAQYQFSTSVTYGSANWNITGYAVRGRA